MSDLHPSKILRDVASAIPPAYRGNLVIVGSLAAGAAYADGSEELLVRTKDVDCLLRPFEVAKESAEEIARGLLDAGWNSPPDGPFAQPGKADTPENDLPAIRLYPPSVDPKSENAWFVELLTVSEDPSTTDARAWTRVEIREGHYGLPSFRYLTVAAFNPKEIESLGISHARPEMMALANLLQHPEIGPETMSKPIAKRTIRRSNKDLGRVIALARLANLDDYEPWGLAWEDAIHHFFSSEREDLIRSAGNGLRELLSSEENLEQAWHTAVNGLLAQKQITLETFRAIGQQVLGEAVGRLEQFIES